MNLLVVRTALHLYRRPRSPLLTPLAQSLPSQTCLPLWPRAPSMSHTRSFWACPPAWPKPQQPPRLSSSSSLFFRPPNHLLHDVHVLLRPLCGQPFMAVLPETPSPTPSSRKYVGSPPHGLLREKKFNSFTRVVACIAQPLHIATWPCDRRCLGHPPTTVIDHSSTHSSINTHPLTHHPASAHHSLTHPPTHPPHVARCAHAATPPRVTTHAAV
jgi:hypothetical protein